MHKPRVALTITSFALVLIGSASAARADARPSALVFGPHSGNVKQDARVEQAVRDELEAMDVVEVLPAPALDLEATQLAVDCVGTDAHCLGVVADRGRADILVIASVERGKGRVELRILRFDTQDGGEPRPATREAEGKKVGADLLDEIPAMLRELFEKDEEPVAKQVAEEDTVEQAPAPVEPAATYRDDGLPLAPLLLGAGGVAMIAAGLTVGLVMNGTQNDYDEQTIASKADVQVAESQRDLGEKQALIANVLLGTGAALVVAGGVWLALDLGGDSPSEDTALVPVVGPHAAGLVWQTHWQGLP